MLETLVRHLHMVKLTLSAVALATALSGCYGILDNPDDGLTENQRKARTLYTQRAHEVMMTACGSSGCHGQAVVPFLAGDGVLNVYKTVTEFKPELISKIDALKSRLLTKGPHSGPEFSSIAREGQIASDYETVLEWLRAEQRAAADSGNDGSGSGGVSYILTPKITPQECTGSRANCPVNTLVLDSVRPDGTGVTGAKIEFLYEVLQGANAPYLVNIRLVGGPEGAYIEGPVFLGYEPGKPNPIVDGDTFFDVKVNTPANMNRTVGAGYAGLTDIPARSTPGGPLNEFAMSFSVVDKYRPDNTPVNPNACKQLAMYQSMMKATLTARCNGCHVSTSGNGNARGAMTLYAADDATSCQQVKTLGGNLNNITASSIYNAPRMGALASHAEFKFTVAADQTAWENAVTTWLTAERNSP